MSRGLPKLGDTGRHLPRYHQDIQRQQDRARIAQILTEVGEHQDVDLRITGTAGGDRARIRGVPITAQGIGGTSPGTDPLQAAIRNDHRLRGWQA